MLPLDHWYIACPISQLTEGEAKPVQIGSAKLVLYRDDKGSAVALLDRCCHRGVKLSKGRVKENGCIACGYHGWEYNAFGKVQYIPSLGPDVALPNYRIPSFHVVEKQHFVWIWMPGEHENPNSEPYIEGFGPGVWAQQTSIWQCNVMAAVENQLDISHTAFSHPGNYPTHDTEHGVMPALSEVLWRTVVDESQIFTYPTLGVRHEPRPSLDDPNIGIGVFAMPFTNHVFLPTANTRAIYHWVPLDEGSVRLEFLGSISPQTDDAQTVSFIEDEMEILRQDRVLLESAQDTFDQNIEKHVLADGAPLAARQIMRHAMGIDDELPRSRTFDVRAYA